MRETALVLTLLLASAARAAESAPPDSSGWVPADVAGAFSAENPASIDYLAFGDQFQNQGTDQWCDQIPITFPIGQDTMEEIKGAEIFNGGTFNGNRQFRRYADGSVAIVDQLEFKVDLGLSWGWVSPHFPGQGNAGGFYFGGSVDAQSLIVRPVHSSDSCAQLKRFFNPRDFKAVLPFKIVFPLSAKRLSEMGVGEAWILPMAFRVSLDPIDFGAAPPPSGILRRAPAGYYLSLEGTKVSDPTVTIKRVGPHETRLRLHLDQAKIVDLQAGVILGAIPATDIGTPGAAAMLARVLPDRISTTLQLFSRQIDSVLGVQLSSDDSWTKGRQVLLQYTLDPTDPKQMEALAAVAHGDLSFLKALKGFLVPSAQGAQSPDMRRKLDELAERHRKVLGMAADLAGIDEYAIGNHARSFTAPATVAYGRAATRRDDHYVMASGDDIRSHRVGKSSNLGFLSLPLFGSFINKGHAEGVQVLMDDSDVSGASRGKPYLIFTREWGVLRARRSSVQSVVTNADATFGAVGAAAGPADAVHLPDDMRSVVRDGSYHKGYLDMSVRLDPQAVDKVIWASADAVARAFAATLSGARKELFDFVMSVARVAQDGTISFDRGALASFKGYRMANDDDKSYLAYLARKLCRQATRLIQDLQDLRSSSLSPELKARALFELASGKGGVSRDAFREIALRLSSREDVSGEVLLHLDVKKTDAANYTVRFVLNPARFNDDPLKRMSVVEHGFIAPTPDIPLKE